MIDLRSKNLFITGSKLVVSMDVTSSNIELLLMSIGIRPTVTLVNDIKNHFNSKNLSFTMKNIYLFLRSKSIVSADYRQEKLANNKINIVNYNIIDFKEFNANMINKGYNEFTQDFLVKMFDDITVNITRSNTVISAITAYDKDQNVISIPDNILAEVTNDIEECNI